jgi:hypothetical protein
MAAMPAIPQGCITSHFHPYNPEIDHEWHEFESFEETSNAPSDNRDISEFLKKIEKGYEI